MKRAPINYFREISERVALNEGWRFALVTLDDSTSTNFEVQDLSPLDIKIIIDRKKKLDDLEKLELHSAEVLEAWSLIEACLRVLAYGANLPLNMLQPIRLLNHLYSMGVTTMEQTDRIKELMKLRSKVAHGMPAEIGPDVVEEFKNELVSLIELIEAPEQ